MNQITLYGSPLSLFTGRARSYLIKAGLDYRETVHGTASAYYMKEVLPKAGGRMGIPTIESAEGNVVRDGAAIIDYYEAKSGYEFSPKTPKQNILSLLYDVIGCEGLLRPAMHYRWNFPEANQAFLHFHFSTMMAAGPERDVQTEKSMQAMRNACKSFGAVPETFAIVEELYEELLEKLSAHFLAQPYLFGGKPSIGDFGMIAPFYGHLGRDPKPLFLMQTTSVNMFRWVERMNRPELDVGEYAIQDGAYLANDEIPGTLIELTKHLAMDFVPETKAASVCINEWLKNQEDLPSPSTAARGVGIAPFEVRGNTINALAQPYRFYLLQRVQDAFAALSETDQANVKSMLSTCGMGDILDVTIDRRIGRKDNNEVWI